MAETETQKSGADGDDPSTPPKDSPEAASHPSSPPVEGAARAKHPSSRPVEAAKATPSSPPRTSSPPSTPAIANAVPARESTKERAFPASSRTSVKSASAEGGPLAAYEAVARSARLPDLVAITQVILGEAATTRRAGSWDFSAKVSAAADDAKLSRSDADTGFGNALKVLGSGPEGDAERALACALWAHVIAEGRRNDEDRLAGDVLWLATHTAFDATSLFDRALGEDADALWSAIGDRIRRLDEGKGAPLGRGEAIVGCASLAASGSAAARKIVAELAPNLKDRTLARLLDSVGPGAPGAGGRAGTAASLAEVRLEGEALPAPRGPITTALLALSGLLFVIHAVRAILRYALAYKSHAEVSLSDAGVRVKTRTEMLGRTLREREHVILRAGLVRVIREVRFPRASFYAGLLALAVGSYIGVRAFADGVRAASPSLLLTGLIVIALGIAADFVLGSLLPGSRGRVRIAFVPRTGPVLCVGDIDAKRADDALARTLAQR